MNRSLLGALGLALGLAAVISAQSAPAELQDRVRALEAQNREILRRLQVAEARNQELEGEIVLVKAGGADRSELEGRILELTRSANDPVTWKDLVKSGNPVRIYGFVRMDAYYDTARASSVIIPATVRSEDGATTSRNDDEFAFDARLTRLGFDIDAGTIGATHATAKLEIDFANFPDGGVESRPTPRIRLAYINLEFGDVALRFGQDWDIISPLYPTANNELLMWNAGNLGDRRPQAQLIWRPSGAADAGLEIRLGAGLTGAINRLDLDTATAASHVGLIDGFDSGHPHAQARIGVAFDTWVDGKKFAAGVWGYVAGLETDTAIGASGDNDFTPYAVGLDLIVPLFDSFEFRGEVWHGQSLGDIRGNIGMNINTVTGEEIEGIGGWGEFRWQVSKIVRFHFGGSFDDPDNDDLNAGNAEVNWTAYVGTLLDWGGGLLTGLDVIYWETDYLNAADGDMVRVNAYVQLNF